MHDSGQSQVSTDEHTAERRTDRQGFICLFSCEIQLKVFAVVDVLDSDFCSSVFNAVISTTACTTAAANAGLCLTLSPPILLRLYTLPYWSNPPFLIFHGELDQYGVVPFEHQQYVTAGVKGVN